MSGLIVWWYLRRLRSSSAATRDASAKALIEIVKASSGVSASFINAVISALSLEGDEQVARSELLLLGHCRFFASGHGDTLSDELIAKAERFGNDVIRGVAEEIRIAREKSAATESRQRIHGPSRPEMSPDGHAVSAGGRGVEVHCDGCQRDHRLGADAIVTSGRAGNKSDPDIVESYRSGGPPCPDSRQVVEWLSRRSEYKYYEDRYWKCSVCGAVNRYNWSSVDSAKVGDAIMCVEADLELAKAQNSAAHALKGFSDAATDCRVRKLGCHASYRDTCRLLLKSLKSLDDAWQSVQQLRPDALPDLDTYFLRGSKTRKLIDGQIPIAGRLRLWFLLW